MGELIGNSRALDRRLHFLLLKAHESNLHLNYRIHPLLSEKSRKVLVLRGDIGWYAQPLMLLVLMLLVLVLLVLVLLVLVLLVLMG